MDPFDHGSWTANARWPLVPTPAYDCRLAQVQVARGFSRVNESYRTGGPPGADAVW
jgi:hypothetical protein